MHTEFTPEKKQKFLANLRESPNVTAAARSVGISRRCAYDHRETDATFAQAWDDAIEEGVDKLEAEVERRAFKGTDKPITFQGQITGTFKEYSDTLAIFLLKAHRPERFRERSEVKHEAGESLADAIAAGRARTQQLV